MKKFNILLVEDDRNLAFLLGEELREKQFKTEVCNTGKDGLNAFKEKDIDLCILDVVLPDMDGISMAREIKELNSNMPIVFLTSRNLKNDKIQGYSAGADDYITKPFDSEVLILKINAILKRCYGEKMEEKEVVQVNGTALELRKRKLYSGGKEIKLSSTECGILKILLENRNEAVSRDDIMNAVWGNSDFFISKSLDVYITKIRKILRENTKFQLETIHSFGYVLNA